MPRGDGRVVRGLRRSGLLAGAALVLAVASASPAPGASAVIGSLDSDGVSVQLRWTPDLRGGGVLEATFAPLQPGFHLYSIALPPTGVSGVGRPTSLSVGGALVAEGPVTANQPVVQLPVAEVGIVPVYPDGPVTVRLPVRVVGGPEALAWLGFAACSRSTCLPPVERALVRLDLPVRAPG